MARTRQLRRRSAATRSCAPSRACDGGGSAFERLPDGLLLAVTQGSFREAKDTLALLGCGDISVSKLRKETLRAGMHWRHHNAACVCAIIAQLRSAA